MPYVIAMMLIDFAKVCVWYTRGGCLHFTPSLLWRMKTKIFLSFPRGFINNKKKDYD